MHVLTTQHSWRVEWRDALILIMKYPLHDHVYNELEQIQKLTISFPRITVKMHNLPQWKA